MSKTKKCKRCCWHGPTPNAPWDISSSVRCCNCGWTGRRYYKDAPIEGHGKYGPTKRRPYKVTADKL